ncbi:MAG: pyruvate carboxylase [Bacteroidota bacterium]
MKIEKVLVANRGEIAIRILRACVEMGLRTVAIYTYEDRYSLHRYKADEAYQVGADDDPLKPYLDADAIIRIALANGCNAIHPGYGFLSENVNFARKCRENGITFIGPRPEVMAQLGDKIASKEIARRAEVPVIEDSREALNTVDIALAEAQRIGYPVMLKAASGGGGRGMRVCPDAETLRKAYFDARSEAGKAFGDDTVFLEKFVANPKHLEIQLLGDNHGNLVHLYERDCSVQRRFQKVVEIAPSVGLPKATVEKLYEYALKIGTEVKYNNAGTVEFLVDEAGEIYFIEVNPRIQVEHTVTEMITGIDIVKAQVYIAGGKRLSSPEIGITNQMSILKVGCALQCRITTEDPQNGFRPDYGTIIAYRSAAGFGIRLDGGSIYQGVRVSPFFDSMLVKVSAQAMSLEAAARKMIRALMEFRIRGVKTNIQFLENILKNPTFTSGRATVSFIGNAPELFRFKRRLDRGTRILRFIANTTINGNPDVKHADAERTFTKAVVPLYDPVPGYQDGTKQRLNKLKPEGFAEWLRKEKTVHYTDTTLRDGHQSLLATRMRTIDMLKPAESFARNFPQTFSMEVWGGATFDVCLRFLKENPWKRLARLRKAVPNILLQMLLRGSNAVGYTAYPDNLIERFVVKAAETGIDLFRIFDSLNWVDAMAPSIEYVRKHTDSLAEAALCYTGNILDGKRTKYNLDYYLQLAKDLENAGAHIIAIKDMAGLLKPEAATILVQALRETVKLPIHLHTHDTSGLQTTTYLRAIEAGVDVVDVAIAGLSGLTSQPSFNSVTEMMQYHERELPYDPAKLEQFSRYWEDVRKMYYPFESGLLASTASVYQHEIPGGQYSNLKRQAQELGLEDKWDRVVEAYAEVNELFGNLVKVTPSSKVVGDMALLMVSKGLSKNDVLDQGDTISFPESVKALFRGDLGQPYKGFPKKLQKMVLKDEKPYTTRPNAQMEPIDLEAELVAFQQEFGEELEETDYLAWKLYPRVYEDYHTFRAEFGVVETVPTHTFFFGMKPGEETTVEIAPGKTLLVQLVTISEPQDDGNRSVFFRLNGQLRTIQVADESLNIKIEKNPKAVPGNESQVGSPLQGLLSKVFVQPGEEVNKNAPLFVIEAMKMENTVVAHQNGVVAQVALGDGTLVDVGDLVVEFK